MIFCKVYSQKVVTMKALQILSLTILVCLTAGFDPMCKRCSSTCFTEQDYAIDSPFVGGIYGKCRYNELKSSASELDALYTKVKEQIKMLEDLLGEINGHIAEHKFYTNDWRRVKKCSAGAGYGGKLRHNAFTATSYSPKAHAKYGRLEALVETDSLGAWIMSQPYNPGVYYADEHLQIDIGEVRTVTGVATQGQPGGGAWVTSYAVYYSTSTSGFSRVHDEHWDDKVFQGNTDDSSMVIGNFHVFSSARYIRIYPLNYHNAPALRVDVLLC